MKILIVDDENTNCLVLKGMLEKDGHSVIVAEDGAQAVERFRENSPEMVLMDIMMPVMDGYEATKIIKSICGDAFVPVIFLTALSGEDAMVSCIEHGGDDFLRKPYDRNILQAKISALSRIRELYNTVHKQNLELQAFQEHTIREHEVAEKIFENVMVYGKNRKVECAQTLRQSAEAFNGDLVLAAGNPSGGVNVLVGDFTGHGLAAAIGALPVSDVFYKMTNKGFSIGEIVPEINSKLRDLLPAGRFLAVCLLEVDADCRRLQVWNGGLPDVLITRGNEGIVQRIESNQLPLGVQPTASLCREPDVLQIAPGDRVHVYSDGVIEAVNEAGVMYGQEQLEALIERPQTNYASELQAELASFRGLAPQADDVTYTCIHCEPEKMNASENSSPHRLRPMSAWKTSMELGHDALRDTDPLPILLQMVAELQGQSSHRVHLFTILSELFNNALEHGVLGLTSGMKNSEEGFAHYYEEREKRLRNLKEGAIRIELKNIPVEMGGYLEILVWDSGKGFNEHELNLAEGDGTIMAGRGLALVAALCSKLEFSQAGNAVKATYLWKNS
ncbi:MAG: fused response regulator/phosphatase [Gammaproteobacteria bacterium]|nr:fused response regulator/phosphatase [Gammaproteobacteria bacterium]